MILLSLTDLSAEPLQKQMTRQIRAMILTGHLQAGDSLPSIRAMAKQQRISVITVQRAYEELEREKLIISRRGKGFFVNQLQPESRTNIASSRAGDALSKVVKEAIADGLSADQVRQLLEEILLNEEEGKNDDLN
jgi:DNA-binding transcriptional regulator YhcF (GntR family)